MKKFKNGDIVYVKIGEKYSVGKVSCVNKKTDKVYGKFSERLLDKLPETMKEFLEIKLTENNLWTYTSRLQNLNLFNHEVIKHIISNNATIVILPNGEKGVSRCLPDDKFNGALGLAIAYSRAKGEEFEIPKTLEEYTELELLEELLKRRKDLEKKSVPFLFG